MENTALELIGYGDGYGYGYGYGDGYGYGGDGYGYGDGYGGDGYGSGGDGDGDGYGSGGDGYGGDGYGDGYGYGYGYSRQVYLDAILSKHRIPNATVAFWRSNPDGTPSNGGSGTKAVVGTIEEVKGPLTICTGNALHATTSPSKWKGERWWIVALHEPIQRYGDKIGSLKRTILEDLGKCPF